jgi:hypothetical protein
MKTKKICAQCGKEFTPRSNRQIQCLNHFKICVVCGTKFYKPTDQTLSRWITRRSCGPHCAGIEKAGKLETIQYAKAAQEAMLKKYGKKIYSRMGKRSRAKRTLQSYKQAAIKGAPKRRKAVYALGPGGGIIRTYESVGQAARELGVSHTSISNAARGKSKTCGGYYWSYTENG